MHANVPTRAADRDVGVASAPAKKARWGEGGKADPVAHDLDLRAQLGLSPKTIQHRIDELPHECAAVIRTFNRHGAHARRDRFMRGILAAYHELEAPPLVPATWQLAQEADAREECRETAFQTDPSDVNLERLIRASESEIQCQDARLMALYVERDRRRHSKADA
jgi:hypothetical protein